MTRSKCAFDLPASVYVYGSGTFVKTLVATLQTLNVEVLGVIDHSNTSATVLGHRVKALSDLEVDGTTILLGIHNFRADIVSIERNLLAAGAMQVLTPPQIGMALEKFEISYDNYWMTNDPTIRDSAEDLAKHLRNKLSDDKSRRLLDSIVKFRSTGDTRHYPHPDLLSDQYFPKDAAFIDDHSSISYLDLGAFNGDSLSQFVERGIDVSSYFAFEPEPTNFADLIATSKKAPFPVICLPFAASDENRIVYFDSSGDGSSSIDSGSNPVQAVRLDSIFQRVPFTHLKLDIEGSEAEALRGARDLIVTFEPRLALSVYHKPDDMWELFNLVESFDVYSRYYLRTYGHQSFDTILYCLP